MLFSVLTPFYWHRIDLKVDESVCFNEEKNVVYQNPVFKIKSGKRLVEMKQNAKNLQIGAL